MKYGCLVSVIIPVYNTKPFINEALDSVIHQTYNNLEIIIIDDGSNDGSEIICDRYAEADRRIIVIHQKNMGLSASRNVGLNRMTGEAVAFLDSDDALCLDFVDTMIKSMILEQCDIVLCRYSIHITNQRMIPTGKESTFPIDGTGSYNRVEALRGLADGYVSIPVWNKLYRCEMWRNIRFPVGHVYEDTVTTCAIIEKCNKLLILDKMLYKYRKHAGSITNTFSLHNLVDRITSFQVLDSFIESKTPEIYTAEQLKREKDNSLKNILKLFLNHYGDLTESGVSNKEELRETIINTALSIGSKNCSLQIRVYYWLIVFCPGLLINTYLIYRRLRLFIGLFLKSNR